MDVKDYLIGLAYTSALVLVALLVLIIFLPKPLWWN